MKKYIECCRSWCDTKIPIERCVGYSEDLSYVCDMCLKKEHTPQVYQMFKDWADESTIEEDKE